MHPDGCGPGRRAAEYDPNCRPPSSALLRLLLTRDEVAAHFHAGRVNVPGARRECILVPTFSTAGAGANESNLVSDGFIPIDPLSVFRDSGGEVVILADRMSVEEPKRNAVEHEHVTVLVDVQQQLAHLAVRSTGSHSEAES
jgi:hypothetical protein